MILERKLRNSEESVSQRERLGLARRIWTGNRCVGCIISAELVPAGGRGLLKKVPLLSPEVGPELQIVLAMCPTDCVRQLIDVFDNRLGNLQRIPQLLIAGNLKLRRDKWAAVSVPVTARPVFGELKTSGRVLIEL